MQFPSSLIKKLLICILSFNSLIAFSQKAIKGIVIDAKSRQPLQAASISSVNNPSLNVFTDESGNFILPIETTKQSSITISSIGYIPQTISINGAEVLSIAMQTDRINLSTATVFSGKGISDFSTLSKIDLNLAPVRNSQELLRHMPGLFIAQHAGGGKAEQIFLRGFDADHGTDVKISVDGMPVNMVSHAHGHGYADAHFIIPETILKIDYGAGPYYAQHGNFTTAGYLSFSTFASIPKSTIQVEAGRYNTFRTLLMLDLLKKNKDKQSAYIASEFNYSDGPTINKQHFNRFNLFGKYNNALSDNTKLTISASAFSSEWDASGQIPQRAVDNGSLNRFGSIDPTEGGNTQRYNFNVQLNHRFNNGSNLGNQFYYSRYVFNLFSNFTFFLNDQINGDGINQAELRDIFGYQSNYTQQHFFQNAELKSVYGAGFRYDNSKNNRLTRSNKRILLNDLAFGNIKEFNGFLFTQQEYKTGKWQFEAGLRADQFHFSYFNKLTSDQLPDQSKTIVSPKLNIQYTVRPDLQFFVKTGKGFHSNDTRVVTSNAGKEILPAAYGTDIGFSVKPIKNLLLTVTAWYLHLAQEFVYVGDEAVVEPGGKTKRTGIDFLARYQFNKNLFLKSNLNFTNPRSINSPKGANYIPLAPTFTSTGGLYYSTKKGLNGALSYRLISDRPANEDNTITAKGYFLMDASINYTQPRYELGLMIENIFNIKWNEAQFATTSRLQNEPIETTELHFTPGTPFFIKARIAFFF